MQELTTINSILTSTAGIMHLSFKQSSQKKPFRKGMKWHETSNFQIYPLLENALANLWKCRVTERHVMEAPTITTEASSCLLPFARKVVLYFFPRCTKQLLFSNCFAALTWEGQNTLPATSAHLRVLVRWHGGPFWGSNSSDHLVKGENTKGKSPFPKHTLAPVIMVQWKMTLLLEEKQILEGNIDEMGKE